MKKYIAAFLSAVFMLSLCACDKPGTAQPSDESSVDSSASLNEDETAEMTTAPASVFSDGKIIAGTIEENVFQNTSTGVRFKKPDSWVFLSEQEIADKFNIRASNLDRDIYENAVADMSIIYDMVAIDPDTSSTVVVAYENIALTYGKDISEEEYFESLRKQLKSTNMIIEIEDKIKNENLNGSSYKMMETTNTTSGYTIKQMYYVRSIGDYFCTIVINTVGEGQLSKIESMFT